MFRQTSHIHRALLSAAFLLLSACGGSVEEGSATGSGAANPAPSTSPATSPGNGSAAVGAATLSWMPPVENTDGSSVTSLAGYHVYRGNSADNLALARTINSPGITSVVLDGLASGTYYFAVSAFLASGAESDPSPVGVKTIP
jgi:hypothetical protein